MSEIALRPRSPTELVDAAFQLYRLEPLPFITALALVYVPWLVVAGVSGLAGGAALPAAGALPSLQTTTLLVLGSLVVYTIASGVTTVMASDLYFGRPLDLARAFRVVGARWLTLILTMLGMGALIVIGFMFLFAPGVYAFARFFAVKQAILLENSGVAEAFGRSSTLTVRLKWHVLGTMGLVFLLNLAIALGAGMVTNLIPSQVIQLLASTAVSVIVYPLVGITETLLYYDIRIRREGFDIEYLAAAAPAPSLTE
jgi:hypothetical protein